MNSPAAAIAALRARTLSLVFLLFALVLTVLPAGIARGDDSEPFCSVEQNQELASVPPPVAGNQRLIVVLARRPEDTTDPVDLVQAFFRLLVGPGSMDVFYRTASYGSVWFDAGSAHFESGVPLDVSTAQCDNWNEILAKAVAAIDPRVDFRNYDQLMIVIRGGCNSRGNDHVLISTAEGSVRLGVTWIYGWPTNMTVEHEMGHAFGLLHANSLHCTDGINPDCLQREYGDGYDVMGSGENMNAFYKRALGWLPAANLIDVGPQGGTFDLKSHNVFAPGGSAVQLLRVLRKAGNPAEPYPNVDGELILAKTGWYLIEYRVPGIYDSDEVSADAVEVRVAGDAPWSHLLDVTSEVRPQNAEDGQVYSGESFFLDGENPLYLHVGARNDATQSIAVRLEDFALDSPFSVAFPAGALGVARVKGIDLAGHTLHFAATAMPPGAVFLPLGDLDQNGTVGVNDIVRLNALVAGTPPANAKEAALADLNGDGVINGADLSIVRTPHSNRYALLWTPDASRCAPYDVEFSVDDGAQPIRRTTTLLPPAVQMVRPIGGESVHGRRTLEVSSTCGPLSWSAGSLAPQPMTKSGTSSWRALWDTTTVPDGDQTVRILSGASQLLAFQFTVDNAPPLLQLSSATVRYYPSTPRADDRGLMRGTLAIPGFDPPSLANGGGPWTFAYGSGFGLYRVTIPSLTCRSQSSCEGHVERVDATGFKTSFDLDLHRSRDLWKFTVRFVDESPDFAPEGTLNLWFCPQGATIGSAACLNRRFPFEKTGDRIKYKVR